MEIFSGFCAINAKTIAVTFGVKLDKTTAEDETLYKFVAANSDAKTVTVDEAELQEDGKTVYLTLSDELNNKATAKYSVNIDGVNSYEGKEIAEYSELLQLSDAVVPTVTGVSYPDSNTVKVTFSEPVDSYSTGIASATKITLDGKTVVVPSSAYTLSSTGSSFTINVATAGLQADKSYGIEVAGLSDFAGNTLTKFEGSISIAKDVVAPTVSDVTAIDRSHVKVEFSEKVKKQANGKEFAVKVNGVDVTGAIVPFNSAAPDGKTFVVTLTTPATAGNNLVTITNFQDLQNNPTNAGTSSFTKEVTFADTNPALSGTAATVKSIANKYYAVLTFDRDVVENGVKTVSGKVVTTDGITDDVTTWNLVDSSVLDIDSNQIAIEVPSSAKSGNYTLKLTTGAVVDKYGHTTKSDAQVTFTYNANVIDTNVTGTPAQSAAPNLDIVTVTFDKPVGDDALDPAHYTVNGVQVFDSAVFYTNKQTVQLKLKAGAITTTGAKVFKVSGIAGVKDKTFDGVSPNPAKINFTENVKPVVDSVELISLQKVRVTFSETVQSAAVTDFEVKVNGVEVTPNSFTVNGAVAVIELPQALTSSTVPVTVSIVDEITDAVGNVTDLGQETTATVNFQDTAGQAKVAVEEAEALFDPDGNLDNATAASARAKYEAAVAAVNNAGENTTYAARLAALKAEVLVAEAEDFAATADLKLAANRDILFEASTGKEDLAETAVAALASSTLKTNLDSRLNAFVDSNTEFAAALSAGLTNIYLEDGSYTGVSVTTDGTHIVGTEDTVVAGISVGADEVTIDGLAIVPASIAGTTAGIVVAGDDVVINEVTIDGTGVSGARGIEVAGGSDVTVTDSEISNVVTGLYANPAVTLTFTGNVVSDVTVGIGSDGFDLETNTIEDNEFTGYTSEGIGSSGKYNPTDAAKLASLKTLLEGKNEFTHADGTANKDSVKLY